MFPLETDAIWSATTWSLNISVFEENGHGLVAAISDIGYMDWNSAITACEDLILNGYSDWHLPTKKQLHLVYVNLQQVGVGGFADGDCWDTEGYSFRQYGQLFNGTRRYGSYEGNGCSVRAVRSF